ncbi:MAG: DNA-directed RNA polymerase subunit D [Candidatus Bathyarchaeota archaeon]
MKIKILEKDDNKLLFAVQGIDLAVANALRRAMIAEVPSMAIEDVIIIENSSIMADEILSHRLGLIPLKTDLDSYVLREKCDCKSELGCGKCNVTLTLEAEATDSTRTVYSKEMKSNDPIVIPVSGEIPILKLARSQKVRLEAYARLGRGSEHAKWQPVSVCVVRSSSRVTIDRKKCDSCEKCVKECPKQILNIEGGRVEIVDYEKCNSCKQCIESCPKDAIKVEDNEDTFIFNIESTGVLPPERIFTGAIEILKEKAQELIGHVSELKSEEEEDEKKTEP